MAEQKKTDYETKCKFQRLMHKTSAQAQMSYKFTIFGLFSPRIKKEESSSQVPTGQKSLSLRNPMAALSSKCHFTGPTFRSTSHSVSRELRRLTKPAFCHSLTEFVELPKKLRKGGGREAEKGRGEIDGRIDEDTSEVGKFLKWFIT